MKNLISIIPLVAILAIACDPTDPKPTPTGVDRSVRLSSFPYSKIDVEPTVFNISNKSDTLLFSKNGLMLYVPKGAFILKDNSKPIQLSIKEYIKPSEALAQNISNCSMNNELLASCKAVHIQAFSDEESVQLSPDRDLRLHFKRRPNAPEISLWRGEPRAWTPLEFDRPKLFHHVLRMKGYKNMAFSDGGATLKNWEKKYLVLSKEEEKYLWELQEDLHLNFTVNKDGSISGAHFEEKGVFRNFQQKVLKGMENFPKCDPYLKNGQPTANTVQYVFHVHQAAPNYKKDVDYIGILDNGYPELSAQNIDHIEELENKYHIFNAHRLGWIAAAHALEKVNSVDLVIEVEPNFLAEVKIMLNNSKVVLTGTRSGNQVKFAGLPQNEPIQIIAFGEKEKQALLASLSANSSDGKIKNLNFSNISYSNLKTKLSEIN